MAAVTLKVTTTADPGTFVGTTSDFNRGPHIFETCLIQTNDPGALGGDGAYANLIIEGSLDGTQWKQLSDTTGPTFPVFLEGIKIYPFMRNKVVLTGTTGPTVAVTAVSQVWSG